MNCNKDPEGVVFGTASPNLTDSFNLPQTVADQIAKCVIFLFHNRHKKLCFTVFKLFYLFVELSQINSMNCSNQIRYILKEKY